MRLRGVERRRYRGAARGGGGVEREKGGVSDARSDTRMWGDGCRSSNCQNRVGRAAQKRGRGMSRGGMAPLRWYQNRGGAIKGSRVPPAQTNFSRHRDSRNATWRGGGRILDEGRQGGGDLGGIREVGRARTGIYSLLRKWSDDTHAPKSRPFVATSLREPVATCVLVSGGAERSRKSTRCARWS